VVHRLTQPQVGGIRQRPDQLGNPHATVVPHHHAPNLEARARQPAGPPPDGLVDRLSVMRSTEDNTPRRKHHAITATLPPTITDSKFANRIGLANRRAGVRAGGWLAV
jgi:hypothetical protein